jgi:asparagine synthase (glutamine-hydrolysing)
MCGITGFFNYKKRSREAELRSMNDAIAHRGPDGDGIFIDENIGLAHRRLAIIDLDTGDQPMFSADKRYVTVFNGEIYNYRELRERLKGEGCKFCTNSDTEIIAESIRTWGINKACREFRGMFAFACYDVQNKKLYLSRDRTGIKPLYYAEKEGALFFASEQKALLRISQISRKINSTALHDTLTLGFPVTPQTCWENIKMFPPANFAEIELSEIENGTSLKPKKYWQWSYKPEPMNISDALEEAGSILRNSLKFHLRSDVPLASFLSGGIDSSLLVALLSKSGLVSGLKTFNVGFDEKKYDESSDAAHVAEIAGTDHHEIKMRGGEGNPEEFEKIVGMYDEPYGDSSCLPTYLISREMRKHVKVVISGDGGDEFFGGYDRFINVAKIAKLRKIPFKGVGNILLNMAPPLLGTEMSRKLKNALKMASVSENDSFCQLHTYFSEQDKLNLYNPEFANFATGGGPTSLRMSHYIPEEGGDIASRLMDTEIALNLHADYLRKVDIASSAHGLEVRVPFLDTEVMDFAARVPMNLKIHSGTLKYLLRELARKEISDRIADKGKWGFGVPFDRWCGPEMQDYLKELLFSKNADNEIWQIFNKQHGEKLFTNFANPESANYAEISRFQIYQRIFLLASTQIWFKTYKPEI